MSKALLQTIFNVLRQVSRAAAVVLSLLILSACTTPAPAPAQPETEAEPIEMAPASPEEPVYRPFPDDSLYALLVAEFAARRGSLDVAMVNYLQQAALTRDPGVAARATRMARYLGIDRATLQAALIWAEVEPTQPEARFTAATELAKADRPLEAFEHMRAVHLEGGNTNFALIAASALDLPEADRLDLLRQFEELPPGNDIDVLIARAVMLQSIDENERTLELAGEVLEREPGNFQAILIEAQVYQNRGEPEKAYARIEQALAEAPGNTRLRLQFARLLAKTDLARAQEQFQVLVEQQPDDPELRLSLALVYRENEEFDRMREELLRLLASGQLQDSANFYLGEDQERRGEAEAAIEHFLQVRPSQMFVAALTRAAELISKTRGLDALGSAMEELRQRWPEQRLRLLLLEADLRVEGEDLDGAWRLLSEALAAAPDEPALLYARSMVGEKRGDVAALEQDLRQMLRVDPDNALALNALGYSLTNLTDRHAEALALISRALELKPDDPAILDSMGWVYYRLGDTTQALRYLQQAFERYPDHEVAAHLGEVLWQSGQNEQARIIWNQGLDSSPDSPIIRATMRRLGVDAAADGSDAP